MTYVALNGLVYLTKIISFNRIVPDDYDNKEYWTFKPKGGSYPWFIRLARGQRDFWEPTPAKSAFDDPGRDSDSVAEFSGIAPGSQRGVPHLTTKSSNVTSDSVPATNTYSTFGDRAAEKEYGPHISVLPQSPPQEELYERARQYSQGRLVGENGNNTSNNGAGHTGSQGSHTPARSMSSSVRAGQSYPGRY